MGDSCAKLSQADACSCWYQVYVLFIFGRARTVYLNGETGKVSAKTKDDRLRLSHCHGLVKRRIRGQLKGISKNDKLAP